MFPYIDQLGFVIALAAVVALAALVVLVGMYVFKRDAVAGIISADKGERRQYILLLAFFFALFATTMSLVYSEVFHFIPCGLCWLQRVFLYPQTVVLGVAVWKRDISVADSIIILSVIGAFFALDQYLLQMNVSSVSVCVTSEASACTERVISEFGFVTFPFISLVLFLWQIVLMWGVKIRTSTYVAAQ